LLQTPRPNLLEVRGRTVVSVAEDGTILGVDPDESDAGRAALESATHTVRLRPPQRLLPGLIDTHIHAPQWPQLGTGLDIPLERWLFEYTFPLEARYADESFAREVWRQMVPTLLAHGTTTAVYFATVHERATFLLAETCLAHGQRAYVGRVAMDHPEGTPEWYRDVDATAGLQASARSIEQIRSLDDPLGIVRPIITPRFIPACSDELLSGLGVLAERTGVLVQTHCSESDWEHQYVIDRHGCTDTESLDRFGLLRRGTVLAHGNHLGESDLAHIKRVGAGVSHCPLSNSYFAGAVFPARRAQALGVNVGIGSDVSGGAHPGLLPQCAMAVTVSRMFEDGVDATLPPDRRGVAGSRIDTVAAFHLATKGGADLLDAPLGLLEAGRQFDAIVVDLDRQHSPLRAWDNLDTEERVFEKIVRLASPADISAVYVAGRRVTPRGPVLSR
jgi:guanine deaminase